MSTDLNVPTSGMVGAERRGAMQGRCHKASAGSALRKDDLCYKLSAAFVDKILKGGQPVELPDRTT